MSQIKIVTGSRRTSNVHFQYQRNLKSIVINWLKIVKDMYDAIYTVFSNEGYEDQSLILARHFWHFPYIFIFG